MKKDQNAKKCSIDFKRVHSRIMQNELKQLQGIQETHLPCVEILNNILEVNDCQDENFEIVIMSRNLYKYM